MIYKKLTVFTLTILCLTSCAKYNSEEITTVKSINTSESKYKISTPEITINPEPDEEEIKWDVAYIRPKAIDKITDKIIRSDYAEYVSKRDNIEISADSVHGIFNFGTENKYRILVMCPTEVHNDDIQTLHLKCMPLPEDDCDCYPFIDIELPSGSYEAFAYKHGTFYPLEEAINDTLISYDMSGIISDYMVEYYGGNTECVYTVE